MEKRHNPAGFDYEIIAQKKEYALIKMESTEEYKIVSDICADGSWAYTVCSWMYGKYETKFFAFGGASSHDIQDGILDYNDSNWQEKAKKLDKQGKYMYRVKDLSWWEEELPTDEEMQHGINVLKENNNMVDFIITHSPSTSELYLMSGNNLYEPDVLTNYLEDIKVTTKYKRHLFGHMHINKAINDKDICLYEQIIRLL